MKRIREIPDLTEELYVLIAKETLMNRKETSFTISMGYLCFFRISVKIMKHKKLILWQSLLIVLLLIMVLFIISVI